jgi:hypothetical protein
MLEELRALEMNKTWVLVKLPPGKKTVSCKWIFTVKQNPKGKVQSKTYCKRIQFDIWYRL